MEGGKKEKEKKMKKITNVWSRAKAQQIDYTGYSSGQAEWNYVSRYIFSIMVSWRSHKKAAQYVFHENERAVGKSGRFVYTPRNLSPFPLPLGKYRDTQDDIKMAQFVSEFRLQHYFAPKIPSRDFG